MSAEREQRKREIFTAMSPRRQRRILEKGYERWDPFLEPKEPPGFRPPGQKRAEERTGSGDRPEPGRCAVGRRQAGIRERAGLSDAPSSYDHQGADGSGRGVRPVGAPETAAWDPQRALEEIREILSQHGLLDSGEELVAAMLEDLVHYAYFTGCLSRGEVGRLLGLTVDQARQRIRSWKKWHEGNRHCQARQNPFFEEWQSHRR